MACLFSHVCMLYMRVLFVCFCGRASALLLAWRVLHHAAHEEVSGHGFVEEFHTVDALHVLLGEHLDGDLTAFLWDEAGRRELEVADLNDLSRALLKCYLM